MVMVCVLKKNTKQRKKVSLDLSSHGPAPSSLPCGFAPIWLKIHVLTLLLKLLVHIRMCQLILAVHLDTLEQHNAVHVITLLLQLLVHILVYLIQPFVLFLGSCFNARP
jgi:hypothetical protein